MVNQELKLNNVIRDVRFAISNFWSFLINNADEFARKTAEIASEHQGVEILLLDITSIADFADYFVIMTGENKRHIEALSDAITTAMKNTEFKLTSKEGNSDSGWILLDYGDIIIHIFGSEQRAYFQLEELWEDATALIRIQ